MTLTNKEAWAIARYAGEHTPNGPLAGVLMARDGAGHELADAVRKIIEAYEILQEGKQL